MDLKKEQAIVALIPEFNKAQDDYAAGKLSHEEFGELMADLLKRMEAIKSTPLV